MFFFIHIFIMGKDLEISLPGAGVDGGGARIECRYNNITIIIWVKIFQQNII